MKGNKRKKTDAMGSVETEEDGKRRSRGKVQAEMERKLWAEETGGGRDAGSEAQDYGAEMQGTRHSATNTHGFPKFSRVRHGKRFTPRAARQSTQ